MHEDAVRRCLAHEIHDHLRRCECKDDGKLGEDADRAFEYAKLECVLVDQHQVLESVCSMARKVLHKDAVQRHLAMSSMLTCAEAEFMQEINMLLIRGQADSAVKHAAADRVVQG